MTTPNPPTEPTATDLPIVFTVDEGQMIFSGSNQANDWLSGARPGQGKSAAVYQVLAELKAAYREMELRFQNAKQTPAGDRTPSPIRPVRDAASSAKTPAAPRNPAPITDNEVTSS
ncbi:hypothetical protein [Planobispora rosea]|uniref:hypothetical protein n=1 Tax=Planobispora rosea TaxID=35762 RepID=UPI00083ABC79|nr:hypothetical protein [Planobispora rosea]